MYDVTSIQGQVEKFVLLLASRVTRIYDALRELERMTWVLLARPLPDDEEIAAWIAGEELGPDDGFVVGRRALRRQAAGEAPGAFAYYWKATDWEDSATRRRLCALSALYPHVASLRDSLPGVSYVYYQDPGGLAAAHPFIDFAKVVDASYDWRDYHSYVSVSPENNPERRIRWTPPNVDYGGAGVIATASLPLWSGDEFVAAWSIDVPLSTIHQNCIQERLAPRQSNFIVDLQGELVAHDSLTAEIDAEAGKVLRKPLAALGGDFAALDVRALAAATSGNLRLVDGNGESLEVIYRAIPEIDWLFVATIPSRDLVDSMNRQIAAAMARVRQGDFDFRIDAPTPAALCGLVEGDNGMTDALAGQRAERERIEADLATEKDRLAVTLLSIGDAVIATDTELRVELMNRAAERITGWSAESAAGCRLEAIVREESHPHANQVPPPGDGASRGDGTANGVLMSRVRRAIAGGTGEDEDAGHEPVHLRARDGTVRLVRASAAPIRASGGGGILGLVVVLRDVTAEQRASEELHRASKLESIGVLAGGIAHDFNNLLTAILGNISLALADPTLPARTAGLLAESERASMRARDLALQLLTFARGGAPVRRTATALGELLTETLRFVVRGRTVRQALELAEDLWPADVDEGQISQVLNNLVLNALQAMPHGGTIGVRAVNLHLSVGGSDPVALRSGRYVRISVSDTGVGIAPDDLDRIFDPYFTTKPGGSGLGLATTYSIVRHHGGAITVESQLGRGSTFHVYLPASRRTSSEASEPTGLQTAKGAGRILVMDDDEAVRALLGRMLAFLGYDPVLTADGEAAITAWEAARESGSSFAAVILDLTVPGGLGGTETLQLLLQRDRDVVAIATSGYANAPVLADHTAHGYRDVLSKPFDINALAVTLQRCLATS